MKKRLVQLFPMLCLTCLRRWSATLQARSRPCPYCGSQRTTWVKR